MATIYGNQWTDAYISNPSVKIPPGDAGGDVKVLYFDHTITAVPTNADILKLVKLPKNVRVIDACLAFPDLGSAGTVEFGWAASAELDSAGAAAEVADADGFMASVDVNSNPAIVNMADVSGAAAAGFLKNFAASVDVQLTITAAWTVTSGTIKGYIKYVSL